MESLLGFEEEVIDNQQDKSSSYSRKLVPWLTWNEWLFVHRFLFSDSPDSVASALKRVSAWRSRGCLPVEIDVTASIIEIQQKDPLFRKDQGTDASVDQRKEQPIAASLPDEMLAMLYCMAIMRLVNGVVEKTRKKNEVSIAVAADAIGLPRSLIDIRHEGSHRELPALQVVRSASVKALHWLKSYYWEPQKKAIPFHGDGTANIKKEIKSKLRELTFGLKVEQSPQFASSVVKRKRSKKQTAKMLKILVQLYSSFSSEVVSVLLEFLLKAVTSSDLLELPEDPNDGRSTSLDDWKLVVKKLASKEPDLLVDLLKAVLDEIEEAMKSAIERQHIVSSERGLENYRTEYLCLLFAWLVQNIEGLKPRQIDNSTTAEKDSPAKTFRPKSILMEVLRKCLLVSASGNKQLMGSAFNLAQLIGDKSLMEKLNKLSSLVSSNLLVMEEENPSCVTSENAIIEQDESVRRQAAKKLELIKQQKMKSKSEKPSNDHLGSSNRWVVAKSWTPCPIGTLPGVLGSSGCLPVLDYNAGHTKFPELSQGKENWEPNRCSGKRESTFDSLLLDNSSVKKMKESQEGCRPDGEDGTISMDGVLGHLMIGGVRNKVGEGELFAIESATRFLL